MSRKLQITLLVFMLTGISAWAQTVTGIVTSMEDDSALPGVSVLIKGTSVGTSTDLDGKYSLTISDSQNTTLVFSYVGFLTEEVELGGRSVIDMSLAPDVQQLNEIVVTALGIERDQKALGYSVSKIDSRELTVAGNPNFASALYGKAPGVKVTTAPGGATSAINVQIRGINSINAKNNQPLYVVDGIMIRNFTEPGLNNGGYWDDQKIRGNGILDINPNDIESLTVLKGASAAALYGSEASNGVIVITTKKGTKGRGLGVDFNYTYSMEEVAFTPKYQNTYGPGYGPSYNSSFGANDEGYIPVDLNGDGVNDSERPIFEAFGQFGPKMDGRDVAWWDGTIRPYSPQENNYKDFYQNGYNSIFNVALSNSTDKANYRLGFTRLDYKSIAPGSNSYRNTFNLNSTFKLNSRLSTDVIVNYINGYVHNRPESINRIMANYGGFFSRADYMDVYYDKYQTTDGYKFVTLGNAQRNPEEALAYNIRATSVLDYLWRNVRDSDDEFKDRIMSSVTLNYNIAEGLNLRGRIGNDFTSIKQEIKRHNEYPIAFNGTNSTGSYTMNQSRYSVLYTDALLTYDKELSSNFNFGLTAGFQSRSQNYLDQSLGTRDGLLEENWFSMSNSYNAFLNGSISRTKSLMYAYLGIVNLSFKEFLYLEATGRQEYHSTLPPGNNSYFYPSVNMGFVFTDAIELPEFFSYGKIRASYASVSNPPIPYQANIAYQQNILSTTHGSVPQLSADRDYGNESIKPERKYETEIGLETRFFLNKIGLDVTYYTNRVEDQILNIDMPRSTGALSRLENIGELQSHGLEIGINATPIDAGGFRWDTRLSYANNTSKVTKLSEGLEEIMFYNLDAGAVQIKAEEGETLGNIYAHTIATDDNGNKIVSDDGLYVLSTEYEKVGSILPDAVGGWSNTLSYKGLYLDFLIDYRFGGKLVSAPLLYQTGAGMFESTMQYRDEEHGGLPYNVDGDGNKVLASSHADADFHDGVLLEGVTQSGEQNTTIVDAGYYYINSFYWASGRYNEAAVYDNDYVKLRELSLGYTLPASFTEKLRFQDIRVSLIGRNLFYIYRTLENLDPEAPIGTSWLRQGIDEGSMAATRSYGFSINARF